MPSFIEIGPMVPEKKNFEGFFTIYGHGGHLGHVNKIIYTKGVQKVRGKVPPYSYFVNQLN